MAITFDDILLSIIAALVGLAVTLPVTYFIVDRIVEGNERKRLAPVEQTAKERLVSKLGVGSLTTFLITLVIDITSAVEEKRTMRKDILELYISKLKTAQSDLEMLLGIYNRVLTAKIEHLTGNIIFQIDHLQEDFQYLAETHPKPLTQTHVSHIEQVILGTVHLTKEALGLLGAEDEQVKALEDWLSVKCTMSRTTPLSREKPIEVSGKHQIS